MMLKSAKKVAFIAIAVAAACAAALATPQRAGAVAWNATDPTVSAISTGGLTDNYGQFTNESVIYNNDISTRGTCTYLNNGWFLTALHVVSTSNYGTLAPASDIQVDVYGQYYTADQFVTWGSADVAMVHVGGWRSGTLPSLTGVEARQIGPTGNGLCQIGGFGYWGPLDGTMNNGVSFHRAFTTPYVSSPFIYTNAHASSRLVSDGYVLGVQQPGDSGSGMWENNGPSDQDLNLNDWSLVGVCQTGGDATFSSGGGAYGYVPAYANTILSTAYSAAALTWNANPGAGTTAVDGSGTWNLTTPNFTNGTNYAFNGPQRTEQAIFGAGNGAAGTVTLGATVPVDQIIFNAPGSGHYAIAGSGANAISLGAGSIITANVNATISANMTGGTSSQHGAVFDVVKNGSATLTLTGTTTLASGAAFYARAGTTVIGSGGNVNSGWYTSVALYSGESATVTVQGNGAFNGRGQDFNLGDLGGTGVLNVQGSGSVSVGQLYVGKGSSGDTGAGGTGTVNQTGGTVSASNLVSLGSASSASVGAYNISGGVLKSASAIYDGQNGGGTMNVSGAAVVAAGGNAYVGYSTGTTGSVSVTGGTLTATGGLMVWGGTGVITVAPTGSSSTLVNPGWITLGQLAGAAGTLAQYGGNIVTSIDNLYVGWGAGATGKYVMHGGSMTVGDIRTDSGTGTIYQDGGTVTSQAGFWIRLGIDNSAVSTYTLAGGTLIANDSQVHIAENGAGTLTIGGSAGGTMLVSSTSSLTVVGFGGGGTGTLNLRPNGLLRTPDIAEGSSGTAAFNFSGGTLQNAAFGNLNVAMPVHLSGQDTVAVDSGKTATFQSVAAIGGNGSLTKTGGGTLVLSGTDSYTGGTLVVGGKLLVASRFALADRTSLTVGNAAAFGGFAAYLAAPAGAAPANSPSSATAVPEPGMSMLIAAGIAAATGIWLRGPDKTQVASHFYRLSQRFCQHLYD